MRAQREADERMHGLQQEYADLSASLEANREELNDQRLSLTRTKEQEHALRESLSVYFSQREDIEKRLAVLTA